MPSKYTFSPAFMFAENRASAFLSLRLHWKQSISSTASIAHLRRITVHLHLPSPQSYQLTHIHLFYTSIPCLTLTTSSLPRLSF